MKYAKAIVASLGAILTVCTAAFADDLLSMDETGTIISVVIVQGITVWGVFQKRNKGYVFRPNIPPNAPEIREL